MTETKETTFEWSETFTHIRRAVVPADRREAIELAAECLSGVEFDAIAVTGVSGIAFGAVLSHELNKPIIIVRSEGVTSHSGRRIEGPDVVSSFIFVDDLIDSGSTAKRVLEAVIGQYPIAKCVGFYEYRPIWSPWRTNNPGLKEALGRDLGGSVE